MPELCQNSNELLWDNNATHSVRLENLFQAQSIIADRRSSNICHWHDVLKWKNFRVSGPLCGEFTGQQWIPLAAKASDAELWCFFICAWTNGWANYRDAGDLMRHCAHHGVTVMTGLSLNLSLLCVFCVSTIASEKWLLKTEIIKMNINSRQIKEMQYDRCNHVVDNIDRNCQRAIYKPQILHHDPKMSI